MLSSFEAIGFHHAKLKFKLMSVIYIKKKQNKSYYMKLDEAGKIVSRKIRRAFYEPIKLDSENKLDLENLMDPTTPIKKTL